MGGTLDTSDDDPIVDRTKGPAKGRAQGGKGGWTPAMDRQQDRYEPPWRCGDINIRRHDTVRDTLPRGDEEALEHASRMGKVRILDTGFIRYRPSIQARGRWDGRNDIFRCMCYARVAAVASATNACGTS